MYQKQYRKKSDDANTKYKSSPGNKTWDLNIILSHFCPETENYCIVMIDMVNSTRNISNSRT